MHDDPHSVHHGVQLVCPLTREPLLPHGAERLRTASGHEYPLVNGVPVLLRNPEEARQAVSAAGCRAPAQGAASTREQVMSFYNAMVTDDRYVEFHPEHDALLAEVVRRYAVVGPSLEVGCGGGFLRHSAPRYIALDYSLTRLLQSFGPEVPRVCASADALPFAGGSVPFIFSFYTLEHVPRPDRAFEEIERILAPGGIAVVLPCWNCTQDACDGIPVRAYRELSLTQRIRKLTYRWRMARPWKIATLGPVRAARYAGWWLCRRPTRVLFHRLRANYQTLWMPDSDACAAIDAFEALLFFLSRGYQILQPGPGLARRLAFAGNAVVARKPPAGGGPATRPTV